MEAGTVSSANVTAVSADASHQQHGKKPGRCKRKRRASGDGKHVRGGGMGGAGKHGHRPPYKKARLSVSSTHAANNIMKFRLGGSVSDPLNLEGDIALSDDCSTCAPSPVPLPREEVIAPPIMTARLNKDPLNLEGKVKNFSLLGVNRGGPGGSGKAVTAAGQKRKPRRCTSGSKPEDAASSHLKPSVKPIPKERSRFQYGNYNRYYGYRNSGVNELDPRLALLHKELLEDKDCLDIGCNTGQVTIQLAKEKCPRKVVGIDIDDKLIKTAWKNLHRSYAPSFAPDGQPFPVSLTLSRGPVDFPPTISSSADSSQDRVTVIAGRHFPHNVQFAHANYVPSEDSIVDTQKPEFDVILALSLSKWIHLNWGDIGIKRFFKKIYHHLRPGGKFILEPQPFSSYSKKKNLTAEIFKNYQNIEFRPHQFHSYLLSPEVGFSGHQFLGVPENKSKGFQRPIHIYMKGADNATPTLLPGEPRPTSAMSTSSAKSISKDTGRLKSVVAAHPNTQATLR